MKPLRALAAVAAAALGWIGWRVPALQDEFAAMVAAVPPRVVAAALPAVPPRIVAAALPPPSPLSAARAGREAALSAASPHVSAANLEWGEWGAAAITDKPPTRHSAAAYAATAYRKLAYSPAATPFVAPPYPQRVPATADALATAAYRDLAGGDRRAAAAGFAAALEADPTDGRAAAWEAERRALARQWSGAAYVYARAAGASDLGTTALLGGGQSGTSLAFTPDPLGRRPLALTARGAVAHAGSGIDRASAQAAVGLRWQVSPNLSLSAERLIAIGSAARDDWTLRLAGGLAGSAGGLDWSGYAEAGAIGTAPPDLFAAGQAYAGWRLPVRGLSLSAGAGAWGSVQRSDDGDTVIQRLDLGPSLRLRWAALPLPLDLAVDYRFRVAGNAAPDSGIAVTLSTGF